MAGADALLSQVTQDVSLTHTLHGQYDAANGDVQTAQSWGELGSPICDVDFDYLIDSFGQQQRETTGFSDQVMPGENFSYTNFLEQDTGDTALFQLPTGTASIDPRLLFQTMPQQPLYRLAEVGGYGLPTVQATSTACSHDTSQYCVPDTQTGESNVVMPSASYYAPQPYQQDLLPLDFNQQLQEPAYPSLPLSNRVTAAPYSDAAMYSGPSFAPPMVDSSAAYVVRVQQPAGALVDAFDTVTPAGGERATRKRTTGHLTTHFTVQKPFLDPRKPWVRPNCTTAGMNNRSGKIHEYDPEMVYKSLPSSAKAWSGSNHSFEYNADGELYKQTYSAEALNEFIHEHPISEGFSLKLWIQKTPADSARRYLNYTSSKCRFADCPIPTKTIRQGHFRVALDERWHTHKETTDPFHVAGYVHLYCLERFTDFLEIVRRCDIEVDTRELADEPYGRFAAALTRCPSASVAQKFIQACRVNRLEQVCPDYSRHDSVRNGAPKPYENTLTFRLNSEKERARHWSSKKALLQRGEKDSRILQHLGDLEKFVRASYESHQHQQEAVVTRQPERRPKRQREDPPPVSKDETAARQPKRPRWTGGAIGPAKFLEHGPASPPPVGSYEQVVQSYRKQRHYGPADFFATRAAASEQAFPFSGPAGESSAAPLPNTTTRRCWVASGVKSHESSIQNATIPSAPLNPSKKRRLPASTSPNKFASQSTSKMAKHRPGPIITTDPTLRVSGTPDSALLPINEDVLAAGPPEDIYAFADTLLSKDSGKLAETEGKDAAKGSADDNVRAVADVTADNSTDNLAFSFDAGPFGAPEAAVAEPDAAMEAYFAALNDDGDLDSLFNDSTSNSPVAAIAEADSAV
ncbi:hypothetical protein B0A49_07654 [Cryomyces minteri]|uniref:Uncharacterized protein n=1 Tax=Cryomyces minteri TaxID=331657 RepID=A0A4U0X885_9PEZI|nr:hypothetical protein B0A49_07654 [Cryomyces minteri]